MAINKSHTSPLMKTMIIALAAIFALGIGFAGISSAQGCVASAPLLPGGSTTTSSTATTTETTASLAAQYTPQVQAIEASLTADPKNYNLLVEQGNLYLDWANALQSAQPSESPTSNPLWGSALTYYQRAVAIKKTDAPVMGDYGISLFFSGETSAAIAAGETARSLDPTLATNLFMLGEYYATAGQNAKAIEAFQAYVKAAPTGNMVTQAKSNITALGGQ
jgi:tetratricopeptide (TPR) repeat protein